MQYKQKAAGEALPSPATDASAFRPLPEPHSASQTEWPVVAFAVSHVAARYGLSLPWATIVAAAAGLGGCQ
jgi:hypothetical protein